MTIPSRPSIVTVPPGRLEKRPMASIPLKASRQEIPLVGFQIARFPQLTSKIWRKPQISAGATANQLRTSPSTLQIEQPLAQTLNGVGPFPGQIPAAGPAQPAQGQKDQPQPTLTKSFRDAVSASWAKDVDVSFPPLSAKASSTFEGEPAILISAEKENLMAQKFKFALIGKFSRGRPSMAAIREDIRAAGFNGVCDIGLLDQRHIILKFQLESDFQRMWIKNTWSFCGFTAKIFRWSNVFCPEKESSIFPVWVTLPSFPIHLCNKETLFDIGSVIGTPLKLDLATAAMERVLRPSEARLCIEVDTLKSLPQRVWIGTEDWGKWQQIIYENLPEYCTKCSKIGHATSKCKLKAPNQVWVQKKKPDEKVEHERNGEQLLKSTFQGTENQGENGNQVVETDSSLSENKEEEVNQKMALVTAAAVRGFHSWDEYNLQCFISNLSLFLNFYTAQNHSGSQMVANTGQNMKESNVVTGESLPLCTFNQEAELDSLQSTQMITWDDPHQQALHSEWRMQRDMETGKRKGEACEGKLSSLSPTAIEYHPVTLKSPVPTSINHLAMEANKQPGKWEEGESSRVLQGSHKSELEILQEMETLVWDEGMFSSIQNVRSPSGLAVLKALNCNLEIEEDYEDCWTETSLEEEEQDKVEELIDKMERRAKPPKQSQTIEALLSPKAGAYSGRKLRDRNPFVSYSDKKRSSIR